MTDANVEEEFPDMFTEEEFSELEKAIDQAAGADCEELDTESDVGNSSLSLPPLGDAGVEPMSGAAFHPSSDRGTQVEEGRERSTKMRVATLAYLLRAFSLAGKRGLKLTFMRLRSCEDAVLHLCGCGIKFTNEDGESCSGCVEPTHLMLGSSQLNHLHLTFHKAMTACTDDDYPEMVRIAHRADPGCERIF